MTERVSITVEDADVNGMRLDAYLADHLEGFSRSRLKARASRLVVNDRPAKLSKRVSTGDTIVLEYDDPEPVRYASEHIRFDILFENKHCIVVNKPRGMVVHPAAGNSSGTLVQGLLYHFETRTELTDENPRPGIVHRLDKDTSGVIIAAKSPEAQEYLSRQFRLRQVGKKYYALVKGTPRPSRDEIDAPVARDRRHRKRFTTVTHGGRSARTSYNVLSTDGAYSFVVLTPHTGRTHQLRVHMKSIGHPILGDPIYSRPDARHPSAPLMLHAYALSIRLPDSPGRTTFRAPLPDDFRRFLLRVISSRPTAG